MKAAILALFIFLSLPLFSQNLGHNGVDFIVGLQKQNFNTMEAGIAYGSRGDEMLASMYNNVHLSGELSLKFGQQPVWDFKAGYSWSAWVMHFSLQSLAYTDFVRTSFALRPEIGITAAGYIDVYYGYNIFPMNRYFDISSHMIGIRFTSGMSSYKLYH